MILYELVNEVSSTKRCSHAQAFNRHRHILSWRLSLIIGFSAMLGPDYESSCASIGAMREWRRICWPATDNFRSTATAHPSSTVLRAATQLHDSVEAGVWSHGAAQPTEYIRAIHELVPWRKRSCRRQSMHQIKPSFKGGQDIHSCPLFLYRLYIEPYCNA
jgi:hypothetical protein